MPRKGQLIPVTILFLLLAAVIHPIALSTARAQADEKDPAARKAGAKANPFPGSFPAPSLDGGTEWLNTSGPISLKDLRGKIVLLDLWTYCCINCMHILPDLKYLEHKYANQLVVIGVHAAKFDNEKDSENIRQAIMRYDIEHPVVNDANFVIARKYQFNSWPTLILIDPEGNFVGRQPGEGTRDLFDSVIGKMVEYHRAKGTLDERPVTFHREQQKAEPTPLRYPGKILADEPNQRLFITDSSHNRIVISSFAGELQDVIGSGQIGAKDGAFAEATFDHPQGLALVGETLYVADTENHLIRKVDLKKKTVSTLAGTGQQARVRSAGDAGGPLRKTALNSPWALLVVKDMLYIAMAGPHQLWRHHLGTDLIHSFAGNGREDIVDGPLKEASLAQPSDLATDGHVLYHVDSEGSAIRRDELGAGAKVTTVVGPHDLPDGRSLFAFGDRDGVGDEVRMQHPIGLTWHDGSLYVADTYNDKIKKVDPVSRQAVTWLGTGERGRGLEPLQLAEPAGLCVAGQTMYIADTNNHRIVQVDMTTRRASEFVVRGLNPPPPPTAREEDLFAGLAEQSPPMTVGLADSFTIQVDFKLPEEHKLNPLAPLIFKIAAEEPQEVLRPEALGKRRGEAAGTSASLSVPLKGTVGDTVLTVTVAYQYCREGTGGVCRFGSQQWKIPLKVAAQGTDLITLSASPGE